MLNEAIRDLAAGFIDRMRDKPMSAEADTGTSKKTDLKIST